MGHRPARAVEHQPDLVDAEVARQVLQHRPALAVRAGRRVIDLGAGIGAGDDELAGRAGGAEGEFVQVALERDGGRLHLPGRQAGRQPFARVRIDLQRQVAVDRAHGAAHQRAAHVDAARGALAFLAPLALQADVEVVVDDPQLAHVDEPVAGIDALDAGIQRDLAGAQLGLFEDAGQGHAQLLDAATDRQVRRASAARQRHLLALDEIAGRALDAELGVAAAHRRGVRRRRPIDAARGHVGGQPGEGAMIQLQPGAGADAPLDGRRRHPGRPGHRLGVIQRGIDLPAPVGRAGGVGAEQAAVEFAAQVHLARQRRIGIGAQHETVRQAAVAHQEIDIAQDQFGRLAQFVLPADAGAMDEQFTLRGQPAQRRMIQVRAMIAGIQVDALPRHPQAVVGIAAQGQFGLFQAQPHQLGRQRQQAAPGQHRRHRRQRQHRRGLVVVDLDRGKIQAGIEALPVRLDGADRDASAQRLTGVGFDLGTPLVHARQDPIADAQEPNGHDAVHGQHRPEQAAEHFF